MKYNCGFQTAGVLDALSGVLIQNQMPSILERKYGPDWYNEYVLPIMKKYKDFSNMAEVTDEDDPIKDYDISAFWFLLFPFSSEEEFTLSQGAAVCFQEAKGLSDEQVKMLESLRTLRNSLVHGKVRMRFIKPEHRNDFHSEEEIKDDGKIVVVYYDGADPLQGQKIVHMDALDYIADAFSPISPAVRTIVARKKEEISRQIEENQSLLLELGEQKAQNDQSANSDALMVNQQNYAKYLDVLNSCRVQYQRLSNEEWSKAPIGEPLELPMKWANLLNEMETLPWPSEEELKEEVKEETKEERMVSDLTSTVQAIDEAVTTAVDLGKSLFKSFFTNK